MWLENGKTLLLGLWPQNEGIVVVPLCDRFCGWILPNTHALRPKAWCTSTGLAGRCQWRNAFGGTLMPLEAEEPMPPVNILHAVQFSVFENSWKFRVINVCILLLKRVPMSRRQESMLSLKLANLS